MNLRVCEKLRLQPQLRSHFVEVRNIQDNDVAYSDVIVGVERLEGFGRAVAPRYVDDLVGSKRASQREFLSFRFQPNLRLAIVDRLYMEGSAWFHGAILPLRSSLLFHSRKGHNEEQRESVMTTSEGMQRLQTISRDAGWLLRHLEEQPRTAAQEIGLRQLAAALKKSLQEEHDRIIPERTQKKMTLFELTVYSPTIEEVWKESGISRLKLDGTISHRCREVFEAVAYKTSKYTS